MREPPGPPPTDPARLDPALRDAGWAVVDAGALDRIGALPAAALADWTPLWDALPPDAHLRDGGRYRRRRHGSFVVDPPGDGDSDGGDGATAARVEPVAHRAHWQPLAYNALHGGLERWFEPLPPALVADRRWRALLAWLAARAAALRGEPRARWWGEAHLFRIDTTGGIGRPTPEGAHRDGVELVAVMLVARVGIKGGETRVFDADGPAGRRFTLAAPGTLLLLDDERVIHETTPIQPIEGIGDGDGDGDGAGAGRGRGGHRDTLVVTLRRGGFQDPPAAAAAAAGP